MRKSCFIVSFLLVVLSSASVIPVLVVKLPRSGSTWFTEMLNKIPWLYISKEVVQHRDVGEFSFAQIEQHLRNALIRPTDKLVAAGRLLPTGRFMEDFVTNLKMLSSLKAVGVSLNVEHVRGVNWSNVFHHLPSVRIVMLERTNLVKLTVSALRGEAMHAQCGYSNARRSASCSSLSVQLQVNSSEFVAQLRRWQGRVKKMQESVHGAIALHGKLLKVSYERLQANYSCELHRVMQFISDEAIDVVSSSLAWKSGESSWIKRSHEDLRVVLAYYDDIHAHISNHATECANVLHMLTDGQNADQQEWNSSGIERCLSALAPDHVVLKR